MDAISRTGVTDREKVKSIRKSVGGHIKNGILTSNGKWI